MNWSHEVGIDLTKQALEGKLSPPVGRKKELLEVVRVLSQLTQNCPVLIGEPGVGKKSVVVGLACRIATGTAPAFVQNKRIVQLDLEKLAVGLSGRVDWEESLSSWLRETAADEVILFIDDLHTVFEANPTGAAAAVARALRSALTSSELKLIGAGLNSTLRNSIATDDTLNRRLQAVFVPEPTPEEAVTMLEGTRRRLQEHHRIRIEDETITVAIDLAAKHLRDKKLPSKAIHLLEKACAAVAVSWASAIPGEEPTDQPGVVTKLVPPRTVFSMRCRSMAWRGTYRRAALRQAGHRSIGKRKVTAAAGRWRWHFLVTSGRSNGNNLGGKKLRAATFCSTC